jgi:WD40 repeat protein
LSRPNWIAAGSDAFFTRNSSQGVGYRRYVLWSLPGKKRLAEVEYEVPLFLPAISSEDRRLVLPVLADGWDGKLAVDALGFDGGLRRLGTLDVNLRRDEADQDRTRIAMDHLKGRWLAAMTRNEVSVVEIGDRGLSEPRLLGRHDGTPGGIAFEPFGHNLATANREGLIKLWDPAGERPLTTLQGPDGTRSVEFSGDGSLLVAEANIDNLRQAWIWALDADTPRLISRIDCGETTGVFTGADYASRAFIESGRKIRVWNLGAPADAEPLSLVRGNNGGFLLVSVHPEGRWMAVGDHAGLSLWPLSRRYPAVIRRHQGPVAGLAFDPEGRWLASSGYNDGEVRLWPLDGEAPAPGNLLFEPDDLRTRVAVSPDAGRLVVGGWNSNSRLVSLADGESRPLPGFEGQTGGVAFSPDGRLAAAQCDALSPTGSVIRLWNVGTLEEVGVLDPEEILIPYDLEFIGDGALLSGSLTGLLRIDVETGATELLYQGIIGRIAASADGRSLVMVESEKTLGYPGRVVFLDLDSGSATRLDDYGDAVMVVALDRDGTIVAADDTGEIRVGRVPDGEPHLLLGHEIESPSLAIDPLGQWIASGDGNGVIRLWPMPDLSKPPLHTLPREELIAKLKNLTNLRVVREDESATGWTLTHDPFPGWETVPTW